MNTAAKIGLAALGAVVALVGVVAVRTATFRPDVPDVSGLTLAAPVEIDGARAAERLGRAIRFQTVSTQNPADADWTQWDRMQAFLAETYPAVWRLPLTRFEGRTLMFEWRGRDPDLPPIVLMAHQDVVPISPDTAARWNRPAFDGAVEGGFVWGRGALDDKGSMIALMEATEALIARGFSPERTVYLLFGHDEEVSGTGAAAAARWFADRKVRPAFVLDEGGVILAENPITGKPLALIATGEKGYATLEVTASGQGGHSSTPPDRTAVHTLAQAVDAIASDRFDKRLDGPARAMIEVMAADAPLTTRAAIANLWLTSPLVIGQLGDSPAAVAMTRTTMAPTMLTGSPKENVLPDRATALINYRLHPRDTRDSAIARARASIGDLEGVSLRWLPHGGEASPVSDHHAPAFRLLSALNAEMMAAPTAPGLLTGATDSRHFSGVAEQVYRFQPVVLTDQDIASIHGVNEKVSIENLDRMAEFYARLIATAAAPQGLSDGAGARLSERRE